MNKKASLKDIAGAVGVSVSLVSYVLNGKGKENRVSEETARTIKEVAKALNYHPNLNARSLKTNKSQTIGLIVADISNPFFSNLARTIEDEAYTKNYTVIFGSSDENLSKFNKVLEFLRSRQVDGFIIAPPEGSRETIISLRRLNIPFVLVDRYFDDLSTNQVIIDNFGVSMEATAYLLAKGHTRIGAVAYQSELTHYKDRSNGYLEALRKAGISSDINFLRKVNYRSFEADMKRVIRELVLDEKIEAIFFSTNTLATTGIKQIIDLGKKVPEEIDVVAFDQNVEYHFFENFIPYVDQPIKEMGQEAVRILIDQINEQRSKVGKVCLGATLKARPQKKINELLQ